MSRARTAFRTILRDPWGKAGVQAPINKVEINGPPEINEDLADDGQTPENQNKYPDGEVLPDENLEG